MSLKTTILKNTELNRQIVELGFVKVKCFEESLLNEVFDLVISEMNVSKSSFRGNQNELHEVTFHSTFADQNLNYKKIVWKHLRPIFEEASERLLMDYKVIQTNVFNKPPRAGYLTPHQNLTTVDEELFTSVSMWAPLQDTDEVNGTLFLKPGSHGHFEKCRNGNTLWPPLSLTEKIEDYGMIAMNLKVGEALIFDDSLVHGSPINSSERDRLIFHCLAIPQTAPAIYCRKNSYTIDLIEVSEDFWQFTDPITGVSEGKVLKSFPVEYEAYSLQSLKDEMVR